MSSHSRTAFRQGGTKRPEWTPEDGGAEFASRVMDGVGAEEAFSPRVEHPVSKRRELTAADYVSGVLSGSRTILSRAITLVESNSPVHAETSSRVVKELLPHA